MTQKMIVGKILAYDFKVLEFTNTTAKIIIDDSQKILWDG